MAIRDAGVAAFAGRGIRAVGIPTKATDARSNSPPVVERRRQAARPTADADLEMSGMSSNTKRVGPDHAEPGGPDVTVGPVEAPLATPATGKAGTSASVGRSEDPSAIDSAASAAASAAAAAAAAAFPAVESQVRALAASLAAVAPVPGGMGPGDGVGYGADATGIAGGVDMKHLWTVSRFRFGIGSENVWNAMQGTTLTALIRLGTVLTV